MTAVGAALEASSPRRRADCASEARGASKSQADATGRQPAVCEFRVTPQAAMAFMNAFESATAPKTPPCMVTILSAAA